MLPSKSSDAMNTTNDDDDTATAAKTSDSIMSGTTPHDQQSPEKEAEAKAEAEQEEEEHELKRLHRLGIPVPAVTIKADDSIATVWLETLRVDSENKALRARVQAVVDDALEAVAPLWAEGS